MPESLREAAERAHRSFVEFYELINEPDHEHAHTGEYVDCDKPFCRMMQNREAASKAIYQELRAEKRREHRRDLRIAEETP